MANRGDILPARERVLSKSGKRMKNPREFKIITATLIALIIAILLHRVVYSAFVMHKLGYIVKYNIEMWKQYYAWLPGKILCTLNLSLIVLLIIEVIWMVGRGRKR